MRTSASFVMAAVTALLSVAVSCCNGAAVTSSAVGGAVNYVAAVVEYVPVVDYNVSSRAAAVSIMQHNLAAYETHVVQAVAEGAQVIVFPEDGLYGYHFSVMQHPRDAVYPYLEQLPNVNDSPDVIIPCNMPTANESTPILYAVSCMAMKYGIDIVLDMGDVQPCSASTDPHCPADGRYQYNTQVAVRANGQFVAKYHKSHLFYEYQFNEPLTPDVVTWKSSFGVTFGMMICFDVMFTEPANSLLAAGVTDFTFPTDWVNRCPVTAATEIQSGFARFHDVTMLAAGFGTDLFSSGSGIYNGAAGHALTFYNSGMTPHDKLLVLAVSSEDGGTGRAGGAAAAVARATPMSNDGDDDDVPVSDYHGDLVVVDLHAASSGTHTATIGELTCTMQYTVNTNVQPIGDLPYVLIAGSGMIGDVELDTCAFMVCTSQNATSCMTTFKPSIAPQAAFSELVLTASFTEDAIKYAVGTTTDMEPLTSTDITQSGDAATAVLHTDKPVLVMAVIGRP